MADAVQKAIDIKADGIYTSAIDASTIAAPLRKAKAAGLKSVCASCTNQDDLYTMSIPAKDNDVKDGYNLAAQMFVDTGGKLRMIMLEDDEFGNTRLRQQGARQFVQECQDAGADCKIVATQKVLIPNISTSVPNQVASVARQHPDWNALFAPYDAILTFVIPRSSRPAWRRAARPTGSTRSTSTRSGSRTATSRPPPWRLRTATRAMPPWTSSTGPSRGRRSATRASRTSSSRRTTCAQRPGLP